MITGCFYGHCPLLIKTNELSNNPVDLVLYDVHLVIELVERCLDAFHIFLENNHAGTQFVEQLRVSAHGFIQRVELPTDC